MCFILPVGKADVVVPIPGNSDDVVPVVVLPGIVYLTRRREKAVRGPKEERETEREQRGAITEERTE